MWPPSITIIASTGDGSFAEGTKEGRRDEVGNDYVAIGFEGVEHFVGYHQW